MPLPKESPKKAKKNHDQQVQCGAVCLKRSKGVACEFGSHGEFGRWRMRCPKAELRRL